MKRETEVYIKGKIGVFIFYFWFLSCLVGLAFCVLYWLVESKELVLELFNG